jgi:UDP-GlcNAc:undecaprenyl-phosphate GlcNAc-1-phosphate transferase
VRRALAGDRVTQPHRGHLYQIAQRAGVDARHVAMIHWGFAAFGGLVAVAFVHGTAELKALLPLLVVPPQLVWAGFVVRRARAAAIGAW